MAEWTNDEALFSLIRRELYTPVVGDVLDVAGRYHQFRPAPVQPLRDEMQVVGRAISAHAVASRQRRR